LSAAACHHLPAFRLRFDPLVAGERPLELPCDERGRVELDALCERQRNDYFYARVARGARFTMRVLARRD
jgi:hypothetical protein